MIAPHRGHRKKHATQDGRPLRRYRRRYKVERLFAWLQNFRRLVVQYEYHLENFLGFFHLNCILILFEVLFMRWILVIVRPNGDASEVVRTEWASELLKREAEGA
jgi:hypothetical protein